MHQTAVKSETEAMKFQVSFSNLPNLIQQRTIRHFHNIFIDKVKVGPSNCSTYNRTVTCLNGSAGVLFNRLLAHWLSKDTDSMTASRQ